ncbi:MAG: hypothetical protein U0935_03040 [Pirellulales bacterium]
MLSDHAYELPKPRSSILAELGADVEIGPFCVVDGDVVIGPGTASSGTSP